MQNAAKMAAIAATNPAVRCGMCGLGLLGLSTLGSVLGCESGLGQGDVGHNRNSTMDFTHKATLGLQCLPHASCPCLSLVWKNHTRQRIRLLPPFLSACKHLTRFFGGMGSGNQRHSFWTRPQRLAPISTPSPSPASRSAAIPASRHGAPPPRPQPRSSRSSTASLHEQGSGDWPEYRHSACFAESSRAPTPAPPPRLAPFGTQVVRELENKWFSRSCRRALKCTAAKGKPASRAEGMGTLPCASPSREGAISPARAAGIPLAAVHFSARLQEITKNTYFPAPEPLVCRTEPRVGAGLGARRNGFAHENPRPCGQNPGSLLRARGRGGAQRARPV